MAHLHRVAGIGNRRADGGLFDRPENSLPVARPHVPGRGRHDLVIFDLAPWTSIQWHSAPQMASVASQLRSFVPGALVPSLQQPGQRRPQRPTPCSTCSQAWRSYSSVTNRFVLLGTARRAVRARRSSSGFSAAAHPVKSVKRGSMR